MLRTTIGSFKNWLLGGLGPLVWMLLTCNSPQVAVDETTVSGHEQQAQLERKKAQEQQAAYDPRQERRHELPAAGPQEGRATMLITVNPTQGHQSRAEAHRKHALEHEIAAIKLQAFEDAACQALTAAERGSCPTLIATAIEKLPQGIRLRCAPEQVDKLVAEMRCHLAFAKARGYDSPYLCPFALQGVTATAAPERQGVDLSADNPATVRILHALDLQEVGM
jgi:hypothetical protein